MGDVRFTLLGPPEVRHADQLLLFSTRKELALLIYLAVEGRLHLRKTLSELFWPDSDANTGVCAPVRSSTGSPTCNSRPESWSWPLKRSAAGSPSLPCRRTPTGV